jgi:membrane protein implicated in regulation of membrane protease activity
VLTPPIVPPPPVAEGPGSAPARKESISELIAFGLVAAGAFIGIASLFLPWSGVTGIGIGTMSIAGSPPSPNQWGWAMPASLLLFLLSAPVLAAAAASDRGQERYPRLGSVIGRVTDLVLPMILGGVYLGVILMYLTVPADYGPGLYLGQYVLGLGAVLLIAGAVVTAFLPPRVEDHPD